VTALDEDLGMNATKPGLLALASLMALAAACGGSSGGGTTPEVDCASLPPAPMDRGEHWVPSPIASFQITHFTSVDDLLARLRAVDVVTLELDQVEESGGRQLTDRVHERGARVICYVSTGYEQWRSDARSYPDAARGNPICRDDGCRSVWPGEAWGDIRHPELLAFLAARTARAAAAGCDGIELDNMDQAFNRTGLDMSVIENVAAAHELARLAHDRGLAALAKNAGEIACALASSFDGVFIEECEQTGECDAYRSYAGKLVAMIEYEADCVPRDWAACRRQSDYFEGE
jgi:hypothetical protein